MTRKLPGRARLSLKTLFILSGSTLMFAAGCGQRPEQTLRHGGYVSSISFSPDGSQLLTAGNADTALARSVGGALKLWDVKSGSVIAHISTGHSPAAVFGGEGKTILLANDDDGFNLGGRKRLRSEWDIEEIKKTGTLEMNKKRLELVSQGNYLAARLLMPVGRNVTEVSRDWSFDEFGQSKDGKKVAVAADDLTVRVWPMEQGVKGKEPIGPALTNPHKVLKKALSPDGTLLLTLCGKWERKEEGLVSWNADVGEVRLWEVSSGKVLFTRAQTPSGCLAFSPDGKMFATGEGENGDVRLWKVPAE